MEKEPKLSVIRMILAPAPAESEAVRRVKDIMRSFLQGYFSIHTDESDTKSIFGCKKVITKALNCREVDYLPFVRVRQV